MFDNTVSRFASPYSRGGVNCEDDQSLFGDMYVPYRMGLLHEYAQDFDQYVAGDWIDTGAGSAALTAGDGGLLLLTSPVSTFQSLQKTVAAWKLQDSYRTWLDFSVQLDSLLGNILVGLLNVTTTPFTGASQTDGIYFTSAVTTGEISINYAVGGTIVTVDTGVALVAAAQAKLGAYWDGGCYPNNQYGRIVWQCTGAGVSANARGVIALTSASTFPGTTLLTPTLGVEASTAVARTLTVDRVYVAKDRSSPFSKPSY